MPTTLVQYRVTALISKTHIRQIPTQIHVHVAASMPARRSIYLISSSTTTVPTPLNVLRLMTSLLMVTYRLLAVSPPSSVLRMMTSPGTNIYSLLAVPPPLSVLRMMTSPETNIYSLLAVPPPLSVLRMMTSPQMSTNTLLAVGLLLSLVLHLIMSPLLFPLSTCFLSASSDRSIAYTVLCVSKIDK